jgi:hypothetical protein
MKRAFTVLRGSFKTFFLSARTKSSTEEQQALTTEAERVGDLSERLFETRINELKCRLSLRGSFVRLCRLILLRFDSSLKCIASQRRSGLINSQFLLGEKYEL